MKQLMTKSEPRRNRIVSIYLSKESKQNLTEQALKLRRSMSELASFIIEDWLHQPDRKLSIDGE